MKNNYVDPLVAMKLDASIGIIKDSYIRPTIEQYNKAIQQKQYAGAPIEVKVLPRFEMPPMVIARAPKVKKESKQLPAMPVSKVKPAKSASKNKKVTKVKTKVTKLLKKIAPASKLKIVPLKKNTNNPWGVTHKAVAKVKTPAKKSAPVKKSAPKTKKVTKNK